MKMAASALKKLTITLKLIFAPLLLGASTNPTIVSMALP